MLCALMGLQIHVSQWMGHCLGTHVCAEANLNVVPLPQNVIHNQVLHRPVLHAMTHFVSNPCLAVSLLEKLMQEHVFVVLQQTVEQQAKKVISVLKMTTKENVCVENILSALLAALLKLV